MSPSENIKRLRDELRACADRLEWLPDWIWEIDMEGRLTYSNPVVERMLGFKPDELMGKNPFSLAVPEDEQRCVNVLAGAVEHKKGLEHVVCWAKAADGSMHALSMSCVPLVDGEGNLTGFRAIARDVTEHLKSDQSTQEALENYRRLVEDSPTGIIVIQDERIVFSNPQLFQLMGYTVEEGIGAEVWQFVHPDDREWIRDNLLRRIGGEPIPPRYEIRAITKSGEVLNFWIQATIINYQGKPAILDNLIDITEQKRTEESLRESEAKYKALVEKTSDWVWATDTEGRYTYSSPRCRDLFGYEPEELIGKHFYEIMTQEEAERIRLIVGPIWQAHKPFALLENTIIRKDGSEVVVETSAEPVLDGEGDFLGYSGIDRDITDRKAAEEELRHRTAELQAIVDAFPDVYFWLDDQDRITQLHAHDPSELYMSPEKFLGERIYDVLPPEESARAKEVIAKARGNGGVVATEIVIPRNGGKRYYEARLVPLPQQQLLAVVRNITERKIAQNALKHSEERYRSFVENFRGIAYRVTLDFKPIFVHGAVQEITGYTDEDFLAGRVTWAELIHPDDSQAVFEGVECMRNVLGCENQVEYRICKRDGGIVWIHAFAHSIADESGTPICIEGVLYDVTERKRDQDRLSRLNETLLSFGADPKENINRLVGLFGELVGADTAMYNRLDKGMLCAWGKWHVPPDYKDEDLPEGMICYDVIRSGETGFHLIRNLQATDYFRTSPPVAKYGLQTYLGMAVRFDNESVGSLCALFTRDFVPTGSDEWLIGITASAIGVEERRKRAEDALQEAEAKYRSLVDESLTGVYLIQDGRFAYVNPRFAEIFGYEQDEIVGKKFVADLAAPDYREIIQENVRRRAEGEAKSVHYDFKGLRKDGRVIDVEAFGSSTTYLGRPAVIGALLDVTERRLAEMALRNSEERYRILFEQSPDMLFLLEEFTFTAVNPAVTRILGYSPEEVIGKHPWDISPEFQPNGTRSDKIMKLPPDMKEGESVTFNWVHKRKDGSLADCEVSLVAYETHGQKSLQAIVRDVTQRKQIEESQREFERQVESQKRQFYHDTILSVTDGKLDICDAPEIREYLAHSLKKINIQNAAEVALGRHSAAEFCEAHGLKGDRLESFVIAVGEALTNAVKHGKEGRIYMGSRNGAIWVGVSDRGKGIESLILPQATLLRGFSTKPSLGLGYSIMLNVADHILLKTDRRGTCVLLIKSIEEPEFKISPELLPDTWSSVPDSQEPS